MADRRNKEFSIENAQLIYRNFAGRESKFNRLGDRNFTVVLPTDVAQQMSADGWNVRFKDPREEGDEPMATLQIGVSFKHKPPKIVMLTTKNGKPHRTFITEDMLEVLDYADIELADLACNGYDWEVNGKTGTKAYLRTLFVTIYEDDIERKYAGIGEEPMGFVGDDIPEDD